MQSNRRGGDKATTIHINIKYLYLNINLIFSIDSILKSREITLPTKVHLVKAMVLPVVMYGCESWTVKKAERRRMMLLNCVVGEDS